VDLIVVTIPQKNIPNLPAGLFVDTPDQVVVVDTGNYVANAGISKAATIEETTVEDFDKLFAVNVRAPYFLVQQLLPVLSEGRSVILVSSLGAHAAVGTLSAYAATKGAIDTLVKYFATALGPRGIRVNAVAPGVIDTDMSNLVKTDEGKSFVLGMQALKRIGQPDDVGSVVAFLASQDARWITGATIHVDGGSNPARNVVESLTSRPGIREQHRPICDISWIEIPQCSSFLCLVCYRASSCL
jgi:NADP-dependent 3-hydroxy acid dehydrogenase YdfG